MSTFLPKVSENSELMRQWDYEKNGDLMPELLSQGSNKKVWWKCDKGHSWAISPNHRKCGSGCSICRNKQVLAGYNDLASKNPELVKEWDYQKNKLLPENCNFMSNRKVWWLCGKGHSWEASVSNRTRLSRGCPYCARQKAIKGDNDLLTTNPELAAEWDYEKNGEKKPDMVMAGSNQKVWWKCQSGHSWMASVYSRKHNGCPYCSGRTALSGINDLATLFPKLAAEWDYEKNGEVTPNIITVQSNQKFWWKCRNGHSWKTTPCNRYRGTGCPICNERIKMKTHYIS